MFRRSWVREALWFLAFLGLTALMTWPWVTHVRDAAADAGDPYLNSWIMWWDFHQTFHDPLHLFHGNVFFPYKYTLALSEHNYGLALPLFPLYALGMRPLTGQSLATLLGFALSGYGAFRLARTLTGSAGAGLVAGIGFAFVPYRFHHLSHVNYLSSGWMPLLVEALVLFLRKRTRGSALWLGVAFTMNALSCIHWFVLTLVPLALIAAVLWQRYGLKLRDRALLLRGSAAMAGSALVLLPFFLPYRSISRLYGLVRNEGETRDFSADLAHWITVDPRNLFWRGLGVTPAPGELCLFPGLLLLLLPLAAVFLAEPVETQVPRSSWVPPRWLLILLDAVAVVAVGVALIASSPYPFFQVRWHGEVVFKATSPERALGLLLVVTLVRWCLAWPKAFGFAEPSLRHSIARNRRPDVLLVGGILVVIGFMGSLGLKFLYHRLLFEYVFLFKSIRAPARSAMVADLGLAVLAGYGVLRLAQALEGRRVPQRVPFAIASFLLLVELRAAPLDLIAGDADPDPVTLRLKRTDMKGGIVELPAGGPRGNYQFVLRAADHVKPLVTGVSGFGLPIVEKLQELSQQRPIRTEFLDFLESIPTSYVVVHQAWLDPDERNNLHAFLAKAMQAGRLRFVARFGPPGRDDLYAVVKTEPGARQEMKLPWPVDNIPEVLDRAREDDKLAGSIDEPAENQVLRGTLLVRGWARNPGEDLAVTILIDGEPRPPLAFARVPRPDVQSVLPYLGDCSGAGYEARFAYTPEDEGRHELLVIFGSRDGRARHYPIRRFEWLK